MAGNTAPIFPRVGDVSTNATTGMSQLITAAAADYTGISANYALVHTADATNGSYVAKLRFKAGGTNVAAVMRIFLNNGAAQGVATNNAFYDEVNLPATTASSTSSTLTVDYEMAFALPAGFRIYAGLGAAVASGWVCVCTAGKY